MARSGVRTALALAGLVLLPMACGDDDADRAGGCAMPVGHRLGLGARVALAVGRLRPAAGRLGRGRGGRDDHCGALRRLHGGRGRVVWVSGVDPGVVAYDAASGEITKRVAFDSDVVQAMATDGQAVYAAGVGPDVLLSIDATTGEEIARDPARRRAARGVGRGGARRDRVGPGRPGAPRFAVVEGGEVTGTLAAPDGALAARFGFGSLWVTLAGEQGRPGRPRQREGPGDLSGRRGARFLAVGDDAVWTLDARDGTVSRIDPSPARCRRCSSPISRSAAATSRPTSAGSGHGRRPA